MTKKKPFLRNTWYDWLVKHIPMFNRLQKDYSKPTHRGGKKRKNKCKKSNQTTT